MKFKYKNIALFLIIGVLESCSCAQTIRIENQSNKTVYISGCDSQCLNHFMKNFEFFKSEQITNGKAWTSCHDIFLRDSTYKRYWICVIDSVAYKKLIDGYDVSDDELYDTINISVDEVDKKDMNITWRGREHGIE